VFLDSFFLLEIIYNFFVGIERRGVYIDDHSTVACTYLREQFLFDLVTSIPGAFFHFFIKSAFASEVLQYA